MNQLEIVLALSSLLFQVALASVVSTSKVRNVLPFFAAYAYVLLGTTVLVLLTDWHSGFASSDSYQVFWGSSYVTGIAWCLAIAELCRYELHNFRGIWALVWRLLALLSALLVAHAAVDASRQPGVAAIFGTTFLRDVSFASIAILAVMLGVRNYYGISLAPLQRLIAVGMCLTCTVDVIGWTVFRNTLAGRLYAFFLVREKTLWPALEPEVRRVDDVWSTVHLLAFMAAMGIWCYALRKLLTDQREAPALLPEGIYNQFSPAINLRLTLLNERLTELLKP